MMLCLFDSSGKELLNTLHFEGGSTLQTHLPASWCQQNRKGKTFVDLGFLMLFKKCFQLRKLLALMIVLLLNVLWFFTVLILMDETRAILLRVSIQGLTIG